MSPARDQVPANAGPFLHALAHALSVMRLYGEGHQARAKVGDAAYAVLRGILVEDGAPRYSFLVGAVIYGNLPLPGFAEWPWTRRLSEIGAQRLEFEPSLTREVFGAFLKDLLLRLTRDGTGAPTPFPTRKGMRCGPMRLSSELGAIADDPDGGAGLPYHLGEEAEMARWLYQRAELEHDVPLQEAEALIRSLAVAMHDDGHLLVPLLEMGNGTEAGQGGEVDDYRSLHAVNVAVLAMTLAESLGMAPRDVRAFGAAGLLHDIGMTRVPRDVLAKDALSSQDREIVRRHPLDGARLLLRRSDEYEIAAVAAYEHHVRPDGAGYPQLRYPREFHYVSKIIQVCDAYDALRTPKSYRPAWGPDAALQHIEEEAGKAFDRGVAAAFAQMMRRLEGRVSYTGVRRLHGQTFSQPGLPGSSPQTNSAAPL